MSIDLTQQAIDLALSGQWKEAIKINLQSLKKSARDVEILNRLGRAYLETGQKAKATEVYKKVLRLDKFNTIAAKNLELLKTFKVDRGAARGERVASALPVFLEEPGVTKTVSLVRLGDPKTIGQLRPGDEVKLVARQHNVVLLTLSGQYLGRISDDLALRLRTFLAAGNTYQTWIRSVDQKEVKVFIKEATRAAKFRNNPSFPLTEKLTYAAFTPPELVHEEKPDVSATEFQEEEASHTNEPEEEN